MITTRLSLTGNGHRETPTSPPSVSQPSPLRPAGTRAAVSKSSTFRSVFCISSGRAGSEYLARLLGTGRDVHRLP